METKAGFSLDWKSYLALAKRRRLHFILPFFAGWALLWGASWIMPAVYRSGTLILVEQPSVPSQYVMPNISGDIQDRLQTMTQQILSRTRLLQIIDKLNLYSDVRKKMSSDDVLERMRKDIEIELVRSPGRDSVTSFNIYYSCADPKLAQRVTAELTDLFINQNLEARQQQSQKTTKFLEAQLEEARKTLAVQEEKVRLYKDEHLGQLPGQLESNLQILAGLQNQLQAEQDALNRAKQQSVYLQTMLEQYRRSSKPANTIVGGLDSIDQELDRLRTQYTSMKSRYTEEHPDIAKLKEQIATTQQMRREAVRELKSKPAATQPSEDDNMSLGPDAASQIAIEGQLKAAETEAVTRQQSIQVLKAKIGDYQNRLNQSPIREQQLADLTRGYEQSRVNYDSLLAKKNNSELATNLELEQQSEHFQILDPPSLPAKPFSPNRMKLCGIGIAVGLFLGGLSAVISAMIDDRIFSAEELATLVSAPVLCEIPPIATQDEMRKSSLRNTLRWAMVGVLFVVVLAGSAFSVLHG